MEAPIHGTFRADQGVFTSNAYRGQEIRSCETGVWAAVKNIFGINVAINIERGRRIYVPQREVRRHIEIRNPHFDFSNARITRQLFLSILKGEVLPAREEPKLLDQLKRDIHVWNRIPEYLKHDRDFLALAVAANYDVLERIPARLKDDRDFLLLAISQNFGVFLHVSEHMQQDPGFRLQAIAHNAQVLRVLQFKDNLEKESFLLEAIRLNPHVYTDEAFPKELKPKFKQVWEESALGKDIP